LRVKPIVDQIDPIPRLAQPTFPANASTASESISLALVCEPNGALLSVELLTRDEQLALIAAVALSPAATVSA
jgi:hypothetical protein